MRNPFKPTAGAEPPILIGRDDVVLAFEEGLDNGCGAPGRLMRISGPRGSGKTVLLNDLGDRARDAGWKVVDVSAGSDFLSDLFHELAPQRELSGAKVSLNLPFASGEVSLVQDEPSLRDLIRKASESSAGLLVTVDEVQDAELGQMQTMAHAVQHLIREGKDVAFVFAGLPMGVADLINGKAMTFLRRALSEELGAINIQEVSLSLGDSFRGTGMDVSKDVLSELAEATGGYPYLIQLVGYYVWQRARIHHDDNPVVTSQDVSEGVSIAMSRFHEAVHEPAISGLSSTAVDYLLAMARDPGPSSAKDLAARLGRSTKSLSSVRRQLIQRQVIEPVRRGYVDFAIPFMGEYLLENEEEIRERF